MQNNDIAMGQIDTIKDKLFPNGSLQERHDNFLNFYLNNPDLDQNPNYRNSNLSISTFRSKRHVSMTSAKAKIRKGTLFNRRLLAEEVWLNRCVAIWEDFVSGFNQWGEIMSCLFADTRNKELDTWPLVKALHERGVAVILSISDFETCLMSHYSLF